MSQAFIDEKMLQIEENSIYEWLWEMEVSTDYEDGEFVNLDTLVENSIIVTDMKQLALQTLYANYQVLKKKQGDIAGRLLKDAVLYSQGIDGLVHIADESAAVHPSLYLAAMNEYDKAQDYEKIEKTGEIVRMI